MLTKKKKMAENNDDYLTTDYCSIHGWGKCTPLKIISVKTSKVPDPPLHQTVPKKSMMAKMISLFYGNIKVKGISK